MHEIALAGSIIKTVLDEASPVDIPNIKTIGLSVGEMSGVMPDALQFGFDVLKKDSPLAGVELKMDIIALEGFCATCNRSFPINNLDFSCPVCHSNNITVEKGEELDISYIEMEEEEVLNE